MLLKWTSQSALLARGVAGPRRIYFLLDEKSWPFSRVFLCASGAELSFSRELRDEEQK